MKILATMGIGKHEEFLAVTRPSFERYAAIHGYELRMPEVDPAPERNHKQWAKVAFINQLLPTCDFLFWIDADAAIVDYSVDIAEELPRRQFLGVVEHRYDGQRVPNTGVMAVRSGRFARRFFHEMWDHTQYLETRWHDNAAALEMFGYEFDPEAKPMYCRPRRDTPLAQTDAFPRQRVELDTTGHGPHSAHRPRHRGVPIRGARDTAFRSPV